MNDTSDTDKLRQRNRELEILNSIAGELNRPIDLDHSLQVALALVAELLGLQTGWIFLLDEKSGEPYLAAAQNLPPGLADDPELMTGSCYCLDTYRAGDLGGAANVNVVTCTRLKWLLEKETMGLRYHSSIPLYASGRKLGVLNVASTDWRELSPDDLRLLYTVGDLLSIAIERSRLFARSAELGALEERNRLAREIHDTLAQGLAAIALRLEAADALLESSEGAEKARAPVTQALNITRSSLEEARRSVLDLRAAPLEGKTLAEALDALTRNWSEEEGVAAHFETRGKPQELSSRVEVGLYRITQEALTNIARHANATQVKVRLSISGDEVKLVVQDNGNGCDTDAPVEGRHGVVGMNERARLLGGSLRIESNRGEGTRLVVKVSSQ